MRKDDIFSVGKDINNIGGHVYVKLLKFYQSLGYKNSRNGISNRYMTGVGKWRKFQSLFFPVVFDS